MEAVVVAVSRSAGHTLSKRNEAAIRLVAGHGVEGDAHAGATVKHRSRVRRYERERARWERSLHANRAKGGAVRPALPGLPPNLRQVHLIHEELHDELRAAGYQVGPGVMGENVTTRGIDLLALPVGTHLHLGSDAAIQITGLRNPCVQLERIGHGLMNATLERAPNGELVRKAGIMSIVRTGGEVRQGDRIEIELPPKPHRPLEAV